MHYTRTVPVLLLSTLLWGCGPAPEAPRVDPAQLDLLARSIAQGEGVISAAALADRLIQAPEDLMLIDLRPAEAFAADQIEGARNLPVAALTDPDSLGNQGLKRQLILYSEDSTAAARAQSLLQLAGREAWILEGGWQAWLAHLHQQDPQASPQERAKRQAVACYFEGDYLAAAGLSVRAPEARRAASPAASAGYTPPLQAAAPQAATNQALGLGLEYGLGPEPKPVGKPDPLGLGLGLGPKPAEPLARPKLIVGEGC